MVLLAVTLSVGSAHAQKTISRGGFWKTYNAAPNSIEALNAAQDMQVFATECDVRLTADDMAWVFQPEKVGNIPTEQLTTEELQSSDCYTLPNGEHIPTLDAYLQQYIQNTLMYGSPTKLVLDLQPHKSVDKTETLIDLIVERITSYSMTERTIIISSDFYVCWQIKERMPQATVMYKKGDKSPKEISHARLSGICYPAQVLTEHTEWISEAHTMNMKVFAWTINTTESANEMRQLGVDALITDEPDAIAPMAR